MQLGMIIYSNDPETVWNALRLANVSLTEGDKVKIFLLGKGVECESLDNEKFKIKEQMQAFIDNGGGILACGTCLKIRQRAGSAICPLSTMKDLYEIVRTSDRIITF